MLEKTSEEEYQKYLKKQLDTIFNLDSYYEKRIIPDKPLGLADNTVLDALGNEIKVAKIGEFKNGYAIVKAYRGNGYEISDKPINKVELDGGLEINSILPIRVYNFIDKNYKLITSKKEITEQKIFDWFYEASDFHYGCAIVESTRQKFYIDGDGNRLSEFNIAEATCDFVGNYGMQVTFDSIILVDRNGNTNQLRYAIHGSYDAKNAEIHKTPIGNVIKLEACSWSIIGYEKINLYQNKSFIVVDRFGPTRIDTKKELPHGAYYLDLDLKDYHETKKMLSYELNNGKDKYNVKYKPIKVFDNRFTICVKKEIVYLYDRNSKEYKTLGNMKDVSYDDNVIVICNNDEQVEKALLIYNKELLDITDYYKENLMEVEDYEINKNVVILSKNDYFIKNENDLKEKAKEEKARQEEEERRKIVEGDIEALEKLKASNTDLKERLSVYEKETGSLLDEAVERITYIEKVKGTSVKIKAKSAFIEVGEENDRHKEINPIFIAKGLYPSMDLSDEDMVNVKVSHLDLSGHNVHPFNPQYVYKKDMSFSNFSGIIFPVTTVFKGVDVRGSTFTTDGLDRTMDINANNFIGAIYDENTTLDGIPIDQLLDVKENEQRRV
jgi:hypothetical protein